MLNIAYLLSLVIIIGLFCGDLCASVLLILPYIFLRKFSGGYHFKSPRVCLVVSSLILWLFAQIAIFAVCYHIDTCAIVLFIGASLSIIIFSPTESSSRKLTRKERAFFKRVVIVEIVFITTVVIILSMSERREIFIPICFGVVLVALLQLLQVASNRYYRFFHRRDSC